jgi:nucleoside-diphosphate-sugar epimerase
VYFQSGRRPLFDYRDMRYLVTGAAGFIGSHLAQRLAVDGQEVVGADSFIPYYPRPIKEQNLANLRRDQRFTLCELDLRTADLACVLDGVDARARRCSRGTTGSAARSTTSAAAKPAPCAGRSRPSGG